ncbi:C-type lectin domain family 2 member H-like [Sylvia borin]
MRGTMVSSPGLLLLPPRQADSEPQLSCPRRSRQLAGVVSALSRHGAGLQRLQSPRARGCGQRRAPGVRATLAEGSLLCSLGTGGADWRAGSGSGSQQLFPAAGKWFRAHAVVTLVLTVLVSLVPALVVALAVQSAPQLPVTPATPQCVLGCPSGWVGYNGLCYYFSRDYSTWDECEERCSELGASLAIVKDEAATDLLFLLRGNGDYWLGLRRRGQRLHWGDGSNFSSRVPVLGNSECVCLSDNKFVSQDCSSQWPYLCSKARAPL